MLRRNVEDKCERDVPVRMEGFWVSIYVCFCTFLLLANIQVRMFQPGLRYPQVKPI